MSDLPSVYYNDNPKSFAYPTCHKRWPIIIKDGIRDVKLKFDSKNSITGEEIVSKLQTLLESLKNDEIVVPFTEQEIQRNPDLTHYNDTLAKFNKSKPVTWLTGPWLFLECYIYQLINNFMLETNDSFWLNFDLFEELKNNTFKQSEFGVLELCKRYEVLSQQLNTQSVDLDTLKLLFNEFIDISLWGNATDLSLLAGNVTLEDIKSVQGAEVRKKNEEKILINDLPNAWERLTGNKSNKSKRVDVILDNSGFELFTDLVLGLFLLDSKLIDEFHIHVKSIPWFVSDTMTKDFHNLLEQLIEPEFFTDIHKIDEDSHAIKFLQSKLVHYLKEDKIIINEDRFWTLDYNYWEISTNPAAKKLYQDLQKSDLVIFKGDLNYRKLTGDLMWDRTTPFPKAIQSLATSGLPVLSLRTCKADVVVGLPKGVDEQLIETYKAMGNEIGEFWASSGKWAVISFNQ